MRGIRGRFVLLIATAGVVPLLLYGALSIRSLSTGTKETVVSGKVAVARQVATNFRDYFVHIERILTSLAEHLEGTELERWQQERMVRNHRAAFPELREIAVFDAAGRLQASSAAGRTSLRPPRATPPRDEAIISAPELDNDGLPTTTIAIPLTRERAHSGWIVAELSLEHLWHEVDGVRVGQHGYAVLLDQDGRFVAHGKPEEKWRVATREQASPELHSLASRHGPTDPPALARLETPEGAVLAVGAPMGRPDWTVIVQQPEWEALAVARQHTRQLYAAIAIALAVTVVIGSWWGRSFIRRIAALTGVTDALAAGRMDARVALDGRDEIAQLGRQFNTMADRLEELQEAIRKQERQAMFGRIAAGLVHDLSHPIQSIGNSCKLIQRIYDDPEYRVTFKETVERELATVQRVLEDLLNIAKPIPLVRFPVDVTAALREAVDSMRPTAEAGGLTLELQVPPHPLHIEADLFAIGRVHRNLVLNAIQATAPGGRITVGAERAGDTVRIFVRDTGSGIPADRLATIFDDFVTTKRRGLGLGLAISRKIVEQLGGTIAVTSEVGSGTTFVLEFPGTAAPPVAVAG